jgi:hypothetical protein
VIPLKIDNTDIDPTLNGDEDRSLVVQWGGTGVDQNWLRPSAWGNMMIYDPNASALEDEEIIPLTTRLHRNYPNPFNPSTTIAFDLAKTSDLSLIIYNVLGQKVTSLYNGSKEAGRHQVTWDGTNKFGQQVGTGVYFVEMKAGDYTSSHKMLLIK